MHAGQKQKLPDREIETKIGVLLTTEESQPKNNQKSGQCLYSAPNVTLANI